MILALGNLTILTATVLATMIVLTALATEIVWIASKFCYIYFEMLVT